MTSKKTVRFSNTPLSQDQRSGAVSPVDISHLEFSEPFEDNQILNYFSQTERNNDNSPSNGTLGSHHYR